MLAQSVPLSLSIGVELPPVPALCLERSPAGVDLGAWWEAARVASEAGAAVVWFRSAPCGPSAHGAFGSWCDPFTVAAAAVDQVTGTHLGVVSAVPNERNPSVLAREVTALDLLSQGRSAVRVCWTSPAHVVGPGDVPADEPLAQLAEAVAVCKAVLCDEDPRFQGVYYHVAGAFNRPPPIQTGGPSIFADVPIVVASQAAQRGVRDLDGLDLLLGSATAVVCTDDPVEVAAWRSIIEEHSALKRRATARRVAPALVSRTTIEEPSPGALPITTRLRSVRDAGADGVIVRVPTSSCAGPELADLSSALTVRFAPWIH